MRKIMISPSKYIQGENEIGNLGEYVKGFGSKALLVASSDWVEANWEHCKIEL